MGYLLINEIDSDKIELYENKKSYSLNYKTNGLKLNKIAYQLHNITITETNYHYYIKINDENDINNINKINEFLKNKNLKEILYDYKLKIKKNEKLKELIDINKNEITICIHTIKKNAYQSIPILYII